MFTFRSGFTVLIVKEESPSANAQMLSFYPSMCVKIQASSQIKEAIESLEEDGIDDSIIG